MASPSQPVIELRSVVALIDRFPALAGVDLDVHAGEVVQLRGSNGAGKTTLLRACAGLIALRGTKAHVAGCDLLADRRSVRRLVGYLPHGSWGYADLTAGDQLRFVARAYGATSNDIAEACERVGFEGRLVHVRIERLSTGQHRRLALACLAIERPSLWLLDEPHAGLDANGRDLLDQLLTDAATAGATVVFASHEHERAASVAASQVTLVGGTVDPAPVDQPPVEPAPVSPTPRATHA